MKTGFPTTFKNIKILEFNHVQTQVRTHVKKGTTLLKPAEAEN
jgi:hypothetical protein